MANPFVAYRMIDAQPRLEGPGGKPLIVQIVMNVECWPFDKPLPRKLLSTPYGQDPVPDIPNYSWVEYGLRIGMSRFIRGCADRGLRVGINLNSAIITEYPALAAALRDMDCEIVGHGVTQRMLFMEDDEAAVIERCLSQIEEFFGTRPRGWLGPGLAETFDTLGHLKAAGIDYVMDWVIDDFPDWLETPNGRLLSVPYGGLDMNDVAIWSNDHQSAAEYFTRVRDMVRTFEPELEERPRVLTLPLHPHVACVPHRLPALWATFDWLAAREDTVVMTGSEITDWFVAACDAAEARSAP